MYLEEAKRRFEELFRLEENHLVPCTIEDVEKLEQEFGYRLPEAYREFLLWMGHSGDNILCGSQFFYADLKNLQTAAPRLLKENNFPSDLPKGAFVFFMHQGYTFKFFTIGENDDPSIYTFREDIPPPVAFSYQQKFSDFVVGVINSHIKFLEAQEADRLSQLRWAELRKQRLQKILEKQKNAHQEG